MILSCLVKLKMSRYFDLIDIFVAGEDFKCAVEAVSTDVGDVQTIFFLKVCTKNSLCCEKV